MRPLERRSLKGTCEVRQNAAGQPMIVGYGIVFNRDSEDMGFIEQVDPGAVTKTLQEADVRALANHDANWTLGRVKSRTLRLRADAHGVWYEIDVNTEDPDGVRALAKVKRGDWDGSSFSFETVRDEWNWDVSPPRRRLLEFRLIDLGPVAFNAYPDATAAARALAPIAERCGKPVDELVSAMQRGEIRSLIEAEPIEDGRRAEDLENRQAAGAAATIGWDPDAGFADLCGDICEALGWMYGVLDVTLTADQALLCDWWGDGDYFVVGISLDDAGEPVVAPRDEWVQVSSEWVVSAGDEDERAARALRMVAQANRAGKMLSMANMEIVRSAIETLQGLLAAAEGNEPEEEQNSLTVAEVQRSLELRGRLAAAA